MYNKNSKCEMIIYIKYCIYYICRAIITYSLDGSVLLFTCFPLCVTEDNIVRSVLKPMAMSSKWAAKKKLL